MATPVDDPRWHVVREWQKLYVYEDQEVVQVGLEIERSDGVRTRNAVRTRRVDDYGRSRWVITVSDVHKMLLSWAEDVDHAYAHAGGIVSEDQCRICDEQLFVPAVAELEVGW